MANSITTYDDTIDSRNVIERIEELEAEREGLVEAVTEAETQLNNAVGAEEIAAANNAVALAQDDLDNFDVYDDQGVELTKLKEFAEEVESQGVTTEWEYGAIFVRDTYFTDYAQQEAEDCGLLENCDKWPATCIDWDQAARELQMDYTSVEFDSVDYWVRSC
jgi:hypothetical protein